MFDTDSGDEVDTLRGKLRDEICHDPSGDRIAANSLPFDRIDIFLRVNASIVVDGGRPSGTSVGCSPGDCWSVGTSADPITAAHLPIW